MNTREPGSGEPRAINLPTRIVVFTWVASYVAAMFLSLILLSAVGYGDAKIAEQPFWAIGLTSLALWIPMLIALNMVSIRYGTANFSADFGLKFKKSDLVGVPIGAVAQLVQVPLITWPFTQIWPDAFSTDKVEERARDLYDTAHAGWLVALFVVVVVGAPFVEELMYRGFIQRGMRAQLGIWNALVITAAWFTLIHLQPVEFPGLFCFAMILGYLTMRTDRIGMSVLAHVGFNAAGLILVATR